MHTKSPHLKTLDCCLQKPPPWLQPRTQRHLATGGAGFPLCWVHSSRISWGHLQWRECGSCFISNGNGTGDINPAFGKSRLFLTPFTACSGPLVLDIQGHSSEIQPWGLLPFSGSGPGKLLTPFKPRDAGQCLPLLCPTPAPTRKRGQRNKAGVERWRMVSSPSSLTHSRSKSSDSSLLPQPLYRSAKTNQRESIE